MAKYRCPRCGSTHLSGEAIISQWWNLDENGNRIGIDDMDETETIDDYVKVAPTKNDGEFAMFCKDCEFLGSVREFEYAIYTQDKAAAIVELFDDLLDKHNIIVPDEDREEGDDTPLYGMTYGDLLYDVEDILIQLLEEHKETNKIISREFSRAGCSLGR